MKKAKPEVSSLERVHWQLFGTVTFKSAQLPERVRTSMYFALARNLAGCLGLHFKQLLWCLRMESGETFGRLHFHFLVGGVPDWACNETTCLTVMKLWENCGGGFARCRLYDQGRGGLDYIVECLGMGADLYESAKFGSGACELMLSESVQRLRQLTGQERTHSTGADRVRATVSRVRSELDQRIDAGELTSTDTSYTRTRT
jgi:hypothetical protein